MTRHNCHTTFIPPCLKKQHFGREISELSQNCANFRQKDRQGDSISYR